MVHEIHKSVTPVVATMPDHNLLVVFLKGSYAFVLGALLTGARKIKIRSRA